MGLEHIVAIGALILGGSAVVALFRFGDRLLFADDDEGPMAPRGHAAGQSRRAYAMEIDKRAVMAFSGNYSVKADWDQVPFFNMLKRDLRESLFDSRTGTPIWDGTTPITVRLATPAKVQTWSDSRVAEERDGTIEPTDYDEWAAYLVPVRSR
jgi:hypothetical protein